MEIVIGGAENEAKISVVGKLVGAPDQHIREQILELVQPGEKLQIDFSRMDGFSSLGLRRLLLFARHVNSLGVEIEPLAVPDALSDAAEAAGFMDLFEKSAVAGAPTADVPVGRIDVYPTHFFEGYPLRIGFPMPLGATPVQRGVNFAVFSHHGHSCTLVLFKPGEREPFVEIPFPDDFRIGDVFAMTVFDLNPEDFEFGYRLDGPHEPENGHRFDPEKIVLDPTSRVLVGRPQWGVDLLPGEQPFRGAIAPDDFDWEGDHQLGIPIEDLVIYETHVRGFTRSDTSGVKFPGTFAGMREKIGYLKDLGVNCVELMPIFEFDELENPRSNPETGERLVNYWGYSTVGFYAPKAGYAATGGVGMQVDEFKALIKELHRNDIEVILDVVFNHTAEGNEHGPTLSFRGLDNRIYYMLTPDGDYYNFSGCGNTLNCNHPVVRDFVRACLRYWVAEYHIDGFRFDLASILSRDVKGAPLPDPPLLESLAMDPVLRNTKLIAEAWDAGGLYQVGTFPAYGRWAEWNGKFRDCVRKFLKGDAGQVAEMVQRMLGSPDVYPERGPAASVNFITCHDGFTLADMVSYNDKHNEANGEDNRDGANDNHSWNCGAEGPTDDAIILALRTRQIKNALSILLLSRGVPMLLMGDECRRTKHGNNNTYCHDNELNWFDWSLPEENQEIHRFCQRLIRFRRTQAALRFSSHGANQDPSPEGFEIFWHGVQPFSPDWSAASRTLAFEMCGGDSEDDTVYVVMNMHWEQLAFTIPEAKHGRRWRQFVNTAAPPPNDICEPGEECELEDQTQLLVQGRSVVVLVSRKPD